MYRQYGDPFGNRCKYDTENYNYFICLYKEQTLRSIIGQGFKVLVIGHQRNYVKSGECTHGMFLVYIG